MLLTKTIKIPIVNFDLSSPILILPSAPDLKLNNTYITPSMQSVDHILSNWENEDFFMKGASVLELLVHNLHMYETLKVSGKIYRKIKKNPGENVQKRCNCIIQSENLILDQLEKTARRFRNMAYTPTPGTKRAQQTKPTRATIPTTPTWRGYYGGRVMVMPFGPAERTAPKSQLPESCDR